jgi:hypothetical protein
MTGAKNRIVVVLREARVVVVAAARVVVVVAARVVVVAKAEADPHLRCLMSNRLFFKLK